MSKELALVSAQVSSTVAYVLVQTAPRVNFQFECTTCMNYCIKHPPICRVWTLHRWPCYRVCFSKTPFPFDHLWRMTPPWRQVDGEKIFRLFRETVMTTIHTKPQLLGNRPASEKQINIHPSRHRLHITTLTRKPAKITHFASSIHQTEIQSSKRTFTSMPFFSFFKLNVVNL